MSRSSHTHRIATAGIALLLGALAGCAGDTSPNADMTREGNLPAKMLILPLEDRSGSKDDGMAIRVTELLVAQMRLVSLSTLGPRDAAAIFQESGAEMPARTDAAALRRYAEVTGCEAVVLGTITDYKSGKAWSEDRLALSVRLVDPQTGKVIRGTSFVSGAEEIDATVRGMDQLALYGVQTVTHSLARAR